MITFLVITLVIINNTFLINFQILIILNEIFLNLYKNFILVLDLYSFSFFFIVSIVVFNVLRFINIYINYNKNIKVFFFLTKIFIISIFLLVFSFNLWTIILGWEGLGIRSFFLIFYYNNFERWKRAIKTFINNKIGDCLILISIIYSTINLNSFKIVTLIFLISIITKSAQYPFISWLPIAIAAPTPISAIVHSSTLVTAGLFIIFRLINNFFTKTNLNLIVNLCLLSIFIRGIKAIREKDIKKIIALSTLSQIGLIFFFLINNIKIIAFIYICNHALFKSLIFINIGLIIINNFSNQLKFNILNKNICSKFILSYKISCLNLINLSFFSSFFIKEKILINLRSNFFSTIKFIIFLLRRFFTINYRVKIIFFFNRQNSKIKKNNVFKTKNYHKSFFLINIFSICYRKIMIEIILFINIINILVIIFYLFSIIINYKIYSIKFNFINSLAYTEFIIYIFPFNIIKYNLDINELWIEKISLNFYFLLKNKIIFKTFNINFNLIIILLIILIFI